MSQQSPKHFKYGHHRPPWGGLPAIRFNGFDVPEADRIKLLGVVFDWQLRFTAHIRSTAQSANSRLHLLRKCAPLFSSHGRATAYKAFVRQILEYCPLVWMGASATTLGLLDTLQRRALHIIRPQYCLSSLSHCRNVAALSYIFKLLCLPVTSPLHFVRHALDTASTLDIPATRSRTRHQQSHPYQLSREVHPQSRDSLLRALPAGLTPLWNSLPATCFKSQPSLKHLQSFKVAIHNHLQRTCWSAAVDFV